MDNISEKVEQSKLAFDNAKKNPQNLDSAFKIIRQNLKLLRLTLKKSTSIGGKNRASCAISLLIGFRSQLNVLKMRNSKPQYCFRRINCEFAESAFKSRIKTLTIINLSHTEPADFMRDCEKTFHRRIKNLMKSETALKANGIFCGEFRIVKANNEQLEFKYMNTKNHEIYRDTNITEWFQINIKDAILKDIEEFQQKQSGWSMSAIINLTMNINKFTPQLGSSYIELPEQIQVKKACINVRNDDNACFAWAVTSALYPVENNPQRVTKYPHYSNKLMLKGIQFPMTTNQIPRFEKQNNISINVYMLKLIKKKELEYYKTLPTYLTKNKMEKHVNLLLIQNNYEKDDENEKSSFAEDQEPIKYHYVWIKDLSRLLSSQMSKMHGKKHFCDRCLHYFHTSDKLEAHSRSCIKQRVDKYFCDRCLHYFHTEEALQAHYENCILQNNCGIRLPTEKESTLKFKNYKYKIVTPFTIYADLECLLKKVSDHNKYQDHEPCSIGYYVKCSYDDKLSFYKSYRGKDCTSWFSKELEIVAKNVDNILKHPIQMIELSYKEKYEYNKSSTCHICEKPFTMEDLKVRDHCHFTGLFRGAAHNNCNLNYKNEHTVPVVFHNLTGYDSHFIIENIATDMSGRVDLLPINKEKYISFTKHMAENLVKFRFIDSFRFMANGLDNLASYLSEFPSLKSQFSELSVEKFKLLTKKGVYPYDYFDNTLKFMETSLPEIKNFYNKLNDCNISDEDYSHACNVWSKFNIKNLGEYSDLYLKTDVLLLADVFEQFRSSCLRTYGLDPAHYFTLPGFTWDSMLKHTGINLELITDIDILMFLERAIRGGLSQCSKRYSKANNKYMAEYDPTKPTNYLMYFDVNNQYGWAMSQYLPYGGFKWVENIDNFDVNKIADDSNKGYILEVDIKYPNELHDVHNDLPFCPEHKCSPGSKEQKLMATLNNKEKYVIHYRNLKQAIKNGLKITKIHKILEFDQSPWLKSYIDLNTQLRASAKNDFEKNLFKLMNNAVFGKTMENVRKHSIVKLVTKWLGRYGAEAYIAKPEFKSSTIFNENLVAIELNKSEIFFNKPIYIGMCILDLAKTTLYDFHYDYMIPQFGSNCKICYTDTDSLIYEISGADVYENIRDNCDSHFDTSDYPTDNVWKIPLVNKKIPGMMKDENNGEIMSEFVGLRSKMYALKVEINNKNKETKKAKGVKKQVVKCRISFDDYISCLNEEKDKVISQNLIKSKKHVVSSITQTKTALSPHDDKRFLIKGDNETLAWGHYKIMDIN